MHEDFLVLARRLEGDDIALAFGVRGNRVAALEAAITGDDRNVRLAGFAPEASSSGGSGPRTTGSACARRSPAPSSPRSSLGSLAIGRPVIFAGSRRSSIARWIDRHGVGWVLDAGSLDAVAADLRLGSQGRAPSSKRSGRVVMRSIVSTFHARR